MLSLLLRNLIFTILQPGVVAGLVPYLIVRGKLPSVGFLRLTWLQYAGAGIGIIGAAMVFYCIYHFAKEGHGTLSPLDPTKRLVAKGLYRYSRNPMYIGVLLVLAGEAMYTRHLVLWVYTGIVFLLFHLFIIFFEEPRLKKDFGESYSEYWRQVRRWI